MCCDQPDNGQHCKSSISLVEDKEDSSLNSFQLPSTSLDLLVDQATQKKKKKKRHRSVTIEDVDADVQLEVNCDEKYHKKKHKHKKIRIDVPGPDSDDLSTSNDVGNSSQSGNVHKIAISCSHREKHTTKTGNQQISSRNTYHGVSSDVGLPDNDCVLDKNNGKKDQSLSSKSNRANGHEFKVAYCTQDYPTNITPELSLLTNSNDSKRICLADKCMMLDCVTVSGNGPCTSSDQFVSAHSLVLQTFSARRPAEPSAEIFSADSIVAAEVSDLIDNSASVDGERKTPSRKKRRTRRRKSKRPGSISSVAIDGDNVKNAKHEKTDQQHHRRDSPWPLRQFAVAPLGSTPGQPGRIVFKDDSSSGVSEEETMQSCDPLDDEQEADKNVEVSVENDCRHILPSLSCDDLSTGISSAEKTTDSNSVCRSNSAEGLQMTSSSHCSALSSFTSTIADTPPERSSGGGLESMLLGKGQYNNCTSKKNNPFANVQVFCRQKFKKMPSVSWDSNSQPASCGKNANQQASSVESPAVMKQQCSEAGDTKKVGILTSINSRLQSISAGNCSVVSKNITRL